MTIKEESSLKNTLNHRSQILFAKLVQNGKIPWVVEISAVIVASIILALLFAYYARGGPNSSDITLYMNIGLNGIKMPFVLNRYFHIFLQAIFLKLADRPLEGYHLFWGFQIGLNTFLVYISARKVLRKSNILHGILAVMIFYSLAIIADVAGVIVVDLTAMTMLTAFFSVYVWSLNKGHSNRWIVGALGLLLFLAFKTKETTLPVAVLLIGLGWVNQERFTIKALLKNLIWVLCGVFVGVFVFVILNWIFIGDPLFGFRLRDWQVFTGTYVTYSSRPLETLNALQDGNIDNWYEGYWFEYTLLPFLLYLISGMTLKAKISIRRKLIWLVPLAFIVFLIITINNRIGYEPRFGLPVLPVLCILAPQFIRLPWPDTANQRIKYLIYLGIGLLTALGIRFLLRLIVPSQNLDLGAVVTLVYYPLLITLLFASLMLFKDQFFWQMINFLILFSLMLSPIASNMRTMFVLKENHEDFTQFILPFSEFEEEISFSSEMNFFIVEGVFAGKQLNIGKNVDEILALFNVYFDASAERENFTYAEEGENIYEKIQASSYDYVLLTRSDWRAIQSDATKEAQLLKRYQTLSSTDEMFFLLILAD